MKTQDPEAQWDPHANTFSPLRTGIWSSDVPSSVAGFIAQIPRGSSVMDKFPQWVQFLACSRIPPNHRDNSERGKLGHKMYACLIVV